MTDDALHQLYLVRADNIMPVMLAAEAGNVDAYYVMKAVKLALEQTEKAQFNCMCLDCSTKFGPKSRPPPAFAIWIPLKTPTEKFQVIAHPICARCANRDDLMNAIFKFSRKAWPKSKPMFVEHPQWAD